MPGVFSTLLAPVLVLWIGAAVLHVLDRFMEPRDAGLAETSVLSLSLGFLIHAHARIDTQIEFGQFLSDAGWRGTPPFLVLNQTSWILALILLIGGSVVVRFSMVITAVFFAVSAVPIFIHLRERATPRPLPAGESYVTLGFRLLWEKLKTVGRYRDFAKFLVAFLIYHHLQDLA